jgi:hypothetical protein
MSTKFEQLLDYLVNEEMDKANELFHEIVVEKSREIYENLIAEEADEETEESMETDEDSVDEAAEDDEENESVDESEDQLEDSYMMDGEDDETGDPTDDMLGDVEVDDSEPSDDAELGPDEPSEDEAMMDIKNAIEELEAAFAELEASQGGSDMGDEFSDEPGDEAGNEFGADASDDEDLQMGMFEGKKRMTREYVEKVGNDWNGNSQKAQGKDAGAGTGDGMGSPNEGKSPISSGKGKPTTGATAANILGDKSTGEGTNVGTKPTGKAGGLVKPAQDMKTGNGNVPGGKMGVKNLTKVAGGHGAEKKGAAPGPVGSGSGDKAGQTSIAPETKKQFLKPYSN